MFGVKNGWERPDYFQPGKAWRRAGADQREFGWNRRPTSTAWRPSTRRCASGPGCSTSARSARSRSRGRGRSRCIDRVTDNRMDRDPGSVTYTQFLNTRGGIVADVTVTRLAAESFRVVTGAGTVDSDLGWLRGHIRPGDGGVELRDASRRAGRDRDLGAAGARDRRLGDRR